MSARELQPRIGEPLPNADRAHINPDKLVLYALDLDNVVGRHKAIVFRDALGIERDDWEYLHDGILAELSRNPVSAVRPPRRSGERYTWQVLVPIAGLNKRRLVVITGWEMIGDRPELITTRVAPKSKQPPEMRG
jgi:hypothetical protein